MQLQSFCKLEVFICFYQIILIKLTKYHTFSSLSYLFFFVLVLPIKKVNYTLNAFRFCGTFFLVVNRYS